MTDFWIFGLKIGIRNIECKFFDDKLPERSVANFEADNSSCCCCGIALGKKTSAVLVERMALGESYVDLFYYSASCALARAMRPSIFTSYARVKVGYLLWIAS